MAKDEKSDIEAIAKRLSVGEGYSEFQRYTLEGGVEIPFWVTYISKARRVLRERQTC